MIYIRVELIADIKNMTVEALSERGKKLQKNSSLETAYTLAIEAKCFNYL